MKTTSFFFALSFSVFAVTVPSCFSADQQYEECALPLRCGPGPMLLPNVTCPFWGVDKTQILRPNRVSTLLQEWSILNFRDLTVNFTGSGQFTLDPLGETIDLFTCPAIPLVAAEPSPFTCEGSNKSSVTYFTFLPSDTFGNDECIHVGAVPVPGSVYRDFVQGRVKLQDVLENGFSLSYTIGSSESCQQCLSSGGICGSMSGSESFRCLCRDRPHMSTCNDEGSINWNVKIFIGLIAAGTGIALVMIALYAQVKKITKSFTDGVGKGGFGIVYKGVLHDGRKVAVKVLKDSKRNNGEDFINEVASMSKTSHVNIVTLLGFCYEGSKRAIIYEFMEKGSLDKYMSSDIDRSALYGIALGVARGLEYLHNGCRERIVHFDIKPQNILLDDNLCPKVSDFGLAKLCENKESIMSLLDTRGTIGYIAPEVFSRMYGRVSHKSDVYSYGMLVLEMIGARNKKTPEDSTSNESSMYFPEWIYKDLEKGYNKRLIENGISCEEDKIVRKMTLVGLWCIQSSPSNRPSMNKVVEMMEGSEDALEVPPKPVLPQIPAAPLLESSWISEENSSPSE
uniref:Protein kinase domain-containing protein n=1 Tax=Brassica oleracea var. oleracea TaxID=109376 RepID=A0A0D3CYJ1_BRAOL